MPGGLKTNLFPEKSRYHGVDTATYDPEGENIPYLRRRFLPEAARFAIIGEHEVKDTDRLDRITAHYFGDPTLFWRICDANYATRPVDLEAIGRRLNITLPEGIAGASLA